MKTYTLIALGACTLFFACKKDKPAEPSQPTTYPNYGAMKTGNYWIYQIYEIDPAGNETPTNEFDSCYVSKDTLINGHTYYKMHQPNPIGGGVSFRRDSLSYIVNVYGDILFSSADFNRDFMLWHHIEPNQDTVYRTTRQMADKDLSFTTPAGTFITSNFQARHKIWPKYVAHFSELIENTRYAKDIGIVSETKHIFLSAPVLKERRLVRYKVQ